MTVNGYTEADDFNGAMVVLSDLGEPTQAMTVLTGNLADPYVSVATLNKLHQNFVS